VPLTLATGTDAGAGLNSSSGAVERATATATTGSCGSFGSFAPVTLSSGADTTVTSGNCYRYRYTISDVLGNATTSSTSANALVDNSAPSVANAAPTEESGGENIYYADDTVYFRPTGTGSFTLNATASDAQSGVASVAFPDVSGTSGWTGSTGGTDTSSPYASSAKYTWTANATAPGAKQITATNGSGLTATKAITINADSVAPTGQTIALNGGPSFTTLSVPLTISRGTDIGAGLDTSKDVVERASAPLASGTCGTFGSFAAVTLSNGADTTVTSGNCYRYQLEVTDNVGNVSAASAPSADAKVDASAPGTPSLVFTGFTNASATGTVVFFRPSVGGSFTVTAASTDLESGAPTFTFPTVTGFTITGTGASRTYPYTTAPSSPLAALTVSAKNASGLSSPTASFTLVPDPTPPTLTVTCNGSPCKSTTYRAPVTVSANASDGTGAGLDGIRYTTTGVAPTAGAGTAYVGPFTVRATGNLRVVAFDKVGNASIPVSVSVRAATTTPSARLVFGAPFRVNVGGAARYLPARLTTSRRSNIVATMTGRGLRTPHRWRFAIASGASIVQLRLPLTIGRPGTYTVRWAVTAGTLHAAKMTRVALARKPKSR
jgi:hypothetical protein